MDRDSLILKKQEEFASFLWHLQHDEPKLDIADIAIVVAEEIEDISEFLKEYKKQLKKR